MRYCRFVYRPQQLVLFVMFPGSSPSPEPCFKWLSLLKSNNLDTKDLALVLPWASFLGQVPSICCIVPSQDRLLVSITNQMRCRPNRSLRSYSQTQAASNLATMARGWTLAGHEKRFKQLNDHITSNIALLTYYHQQESSV